MKYYAIPLKNINGLTVGKQYKISPYLVNQGQLLICNDDNKLVSFGLYDYQMKIVSEDELLYQNKLKELIKEYKQKSEDYYDPDCAYLIYEQIIDDLENILNEQI